MREWAVTTTFTGAVSPQEAMRIEQSLGDATVANIPQAQQITVTIHVEQESPVAAVASALAEIVEAVKLSIVAVEVVDEIEHERRANSATIPELVGASEAAEILGVSRQRVHQLHRENPAFPAPLVQVAMGPLWHRAAVEAFAQRWERRPGRPRVALVTTNGRSS